VQIDNRRGLDTTSVDQTRRENIEDKSPRPADMVNAERVTHATIAQQNAN